MHIRSVRRTASADVQAILRHNVRLDRIAHLPIDTLRFHNRKLRKRSDDAQQALATSVASFGIVLPILIDASRTIIGGEGIVEAAKKLG